VLITNDLVGFGALEALAMSSIDVPGEVSVVGFDDLGQQVSPTLTTVRGDLHGLGRRSAEALFRLIASGTSAAGGEVLPVEVVVRNTTSAPAVRV
jgi:DNA-binding LacI/PurR family transcriptional regulator